METFTRTRGFCWDTCILGCGGKAYCKQKWIAMSFPALHSPLPVFGPKTCTQTPRGLTSVRAKQHHHSLRTPPAQVDDMDYFPEVVLLKKRGIWDGGKPLPEYAEAEEEKLVGSLELQLETGIKIQRIRHYEVIYLIHEDYAQEVDSVKKSIEGFLNEKKAKVWRLNDWGMRRLCYKIKRAMNAYYVLMNFEMAARYIKEFAEFLNRDERVIRYLLCKKKEAETEDCPPPPEFHTLRAKIQGMEDGIDADCIAREEDVEYQDVGFGEIFDCLYGRESNGEREKENHVDGDVDDEAKDS